ncbi:MAG TPA: TfoX/Sxy family protein [Roseiflexaceae bacterium]|nr:TfoX/Sxy family protein [Roseiflexaceae bacterium]
MAYDERLAARIRAILADQPALVEKKMFGGLAFMLQGHMCCGVVREELTARVGPAQYADALGMPYARELDFTGRPMTGMVIVAPEGLAEDEDLAAWVQRGVQFVETLPPK